MTKERLNEFLNKKSVSPDDFEMPALSLRLKMKSPLNTKSRNTNSTGAENFDTFNILFSISTGIKYALKLEESTKSKKTRSTLK